MNRFTITYTVKYELSTSPEYVWNEYNECFNLKTGRKIKQILKNGVIGYCIKGKFKSLKSLRPLLQKPKIIKIPF